MKFFTRNYCFYEYVLANISIAFIIAYLDKREIGRLLLNRHQFVAFPPNATYEKEFEDMKLPVCGSTPPLECNLDMDSQNYDLESNWSELQNMIWI